MQDLFKIYREYVKVETTDQINKGMIEIELLSFEEFKMLMNQFSEGRQLSYVGSME